MLDISLEGFEHLDLELNDGTLTVWFNEPKRRNPLTGARVEDLRNLAISLAESAHIRCVVFRGRGNMFCAGGDLEAFRNMAAVSDDALADTSCAIAILMDHVRSLPQITIAVVEGAAVAGGIGLASACDFVVATPDTRFSLSEVRLGLVAAQIAPFLIDKLGMGGTRRLMLLGDWLTGVPAHAIGLVDILCEQTEIASQIGALRRSIAFTSPQAVAQTKGLLATLPHLDRAAQIDLAAKTFVNAVRSDDGMEGLQSFAEKRPTKWSKEPC